MCFILLEQIVKWTFTHTHIVCTNLLKHMYVIQNQEYMFLM